MLGCTPQTITNYARYGLIDELHRELNGRDGYYYDEDQLLALAPRLTEISELEERIAARRESLLQEERALEEERYRARRQFILSAGGEKTWNRMRGLVIAAYGYAGKVKPPLEDMFDVKVLAAFLSLKDYEEACHELKASRYKMDAAVSRICRRMLAIPNMKKEMETLRSENARIWEDNYRLQKAYEMLEAMRSVEESGSFEDRFLEKEAKELIPLKTAHIASLHLPLRAEEAVVRIGVKSVFDLVGLTEEDFKRLSRSRQPVIDEVKEALTAKGLCFGMHTMNRAALGHNYTKEVNPEE